MIRIAIADDHPIFRKGLAEVISGFAEMTVVMEAANGKELIKKLHESNSVPDICVLDINMPIMNGYDTTTYIRSHFEHLKVLALSMYNAEINIIKMLRCGANGYILKDDEPEKLRSAITSIHVNGFFTSDVVTGRMLRTLHSHGESTPFDLSDNELRFIKLCCTELTYKEIAEKMGLSPRTIDGYREALFQRLRLTTRSGLVVFAMNAGLGIESQQT